MSKKKNTMGHSIGKAVKKRLLTSKYFTVQLLLRQNANELKINENVTQSWEETCRFYMFQKKGESI